jgi:CheY-like chemotaxis protein
VDAKRLAVTVALRATDANVWADPGRLQQVFLNLLSNAVKFTPDEGGVTVRTSNGGVGGALRVEISDTGVGLEAELLPRLFTPFEQGEQGQVRQFGGLGLGLSIVKSLLQMHGGRVSASSEGTNKGATFIVEIGTLNGTEGGRTEPAPAAPARGPDEPPRRILLVEDHADTRKVMTRLLSSFGFAVTAAGTVREALELAGGQRFDLLVSDIGLPDGTGMDLMRELRQRQPIRGIALSGFGQDEDLRRSEEAGFERHLTKPVNFHTLREVVMKVAS